MCIRDRLRVISHDSAWHECSLASQPTWMKSRSCTLKQLIWHPMSVEWNLCCYVCSAVSDKCVCDWNIKTFENDIKTLKKYKNKNLWKIINWRLKMFYQTLTTHKLRKAGKMPFFVPGYLDLWSLFLTFKLVWPSDQTRLPSELVNLVQIHSTVHTQ